MKEKVGEKMAKSSIDRIREAEISAAQRKKQISEELSASLSESRAKAEKLSLIHI